MRNLKISLMSALLVLVASQAAQAADPVFFKAPIQFNGTGCNPYNISVVGENTSSLTVLFGGYDAGKNAVSGLARSSCNFAVPVHVPRGWQLSVLTADWQGFAQGRAKFTRSYGTSLNPRLVLPPPKTISSAGGTDWSAKDGLMHSTMASGCQGGDFNLRINSGLQAIGSNSYAAVDTVDLNNKVVFHLKWLPCN